MCFLRLLGCALLGSLAFSGFQARAGDKPKTLELKLPGNLKLKLVRIDAGKFLMGSLPGEEDRDDSDEGPQHEVEITKAFYMGVYEVTRGQFRAFVNATSYKTDAETDGKGGSGYKNNRFSTEPQYNWRNTGFEQSDDHPVVNVSWNDAIAFCGWLSRTMNKTVTLPTEAQWEYACRAGTKTRFSSGDANASLSKVANIADLSLKPRGIYWELKDKEFEKRISTWFDKVSWNDGYPFTAPVGQFQSNAWGLYDMHGNTWEWCQDWYDANYYKISPKADPQGPDTGKSRVGRGGAWVNDPRGCRSAFRDSSTPASRIYYSGFRVVLSLP